MSPTISVPKRKLGKNSGVKMERIRMVSHSNDRPFASQYNWSERSQVNSRFTLKTILILFVFGELGQTQLCVCYENNLNKFHFL